MSFLKSITLILALALVAMAQTSTVPVGAKLFIAPMSGDLDGFIAAEIIKQKLPVIVTTDEKDADFIMTGASIKADDHWYNVAFKMGGKDKNEGNVRLLNVAEKRMIWAGEAGDRSLLFTGYRRGGERKVADRLVKTMKHDLFQGN
jgi:hypothetical protein